MDPKTAACLLRTSFGLLLLWGLFYVSIRQLLLDSLRQKLFAIRDRVFDFAADGGIDFNDPTYRRTRDNLNNLIRFADKLTAIRVLFVLMEDLPERSIREMELWQQQMDNLAPVPRRVLSDAASEAHVIVMRYVFQRSLFPYLVYLAIQLTALWLSTVRRFYSEWLPGVATHLEAQAHEEYRTAA